MERGSLLAVTRLYSVRNFFLEVREGQHLGVQTNLYRLKLQQIWNCCNSPPDIFSDVSTSPLSVSQNKTCWSSAITCKAKQTKHNTTHQKPSFFILAASDGIRTHSPLSRRCSYQLNHMNCLVPSLFVSVAFCMHCFQLNIRFKWSLNCLDSTLPWFIHVYYSAEMPH